MGGGRGKSWLRLRAAELLSALVSVAALGCAGGHPQGSEEKGPSTRPLDAEIESFALSLIAPDLPSERRVPGLVIGIHVSGGSETHGFGTTALPSELAPDGDTLFRVGSLTEVTTALLLGRLVSEGRLRLEDPVAPCAILSLPASPLCAEGATMTLEHLARHTSGLPAPSDQGDETEAYLGALRLRRPPGTGFEPSSVGYALLGQKLGHSMGLDYPEAVDEGVLQPLSMGSTSFWVPVRDLSRFAVGHRGEQAIDRFNRESVLDPSQGMITSANDLLALVAPRLEELPRALAQAIEQVRESGADLESLPGSTAGIGWHLRAGSGLMWKEARGDGYGAFLAFDPRKAAAVVVLLNRELDADDRRVADGALNLIGRL